MKIVYQNGIFCDMIWLSKSLNKTQNAIRVVVLLPFVVMRPMLPKLGLVVQSNELFFLLSIACDFVVPV